jgi:hypothetical protein
VKHRRRAGTPRKDEIATTGAIAEKELQRWLAQARYVGNPAHKTSSADFGLEGHNT